PGGLGERRRALHHAALRDDAIIGDGVEPRQAGDHFSTSPAATPRPFTNAAAVIFALPAGWTSVTATAPRPQEITSLSPASRTVPGMTTGVSAMASSTLRPDSASSPASRLPPASSVPLLPPDTSRAP